MAQPLSWREHIRLMLSDIGRGLLLLTHSGLAMLSVSVLALLLALWSQPQWLRSAEQAVFDWLRERDVLVTWLPENTVDRAKALDPDTLPAAQARVTHWLSEKYRVAPEPLAALVAHAHTVGAKLKLPAHLILGVMAIESSFHPLVQSHVGAQGLMQVMGHMHAKRFEPHGGLDVAFDPLVNLQVGAEVLADAIRARGSLEAGLRFYLGGDLVTEESGGGYVGKVLAERARLDQVAAGAQVPMHAALPQAAAQQVPAPATHEAAEVSALPPAAAPAHAAQPAASEP